MPVVFGPSAGPRQGPTGSAFDMRDAPRTTTIIRYLTDTKRLSALLPSRCALEGDPVVTIEHSVLHRLDWLAGRGYSMLGVKFPARYSGRNGNVKGPFLSVLWENRVEPILTGRDELGYPKLYCELPPMRELAGTRHLEATIDGHTFIRLRVQDLAPEKPPATSAGAGVLLHRYLPAIQPDGAPSVDEMVMSPACNSPMRYRGFWCGAGSVEFVRSTWEQLPTTFHIVNALADLPILEVRSATVAETLGAKDLADTHVVD
jgi:acetoacetate decarboxylase